MTKIKFRSTTFDVLNSLSIIHGNVTYSTDTKEVFYDYQEGIRGSISCVICANESVRVGIRPQDRDYNTLYYVILTDKFYIVDIENGNFKEITYVEEIQHITGEIIDLRPGFLHNKIKYYSPYTTSGSIIMDDSIDLPGGPYSLQDYINQGKLTANGFTAGIKTSLKTLTIEEDGTSDVIVDYPIGNYSTSGFDFILFKNSMFVPPTEYTINEDKISIINPDNYFDSGDELTFVFFYSSILEPEDGESSGNQNTNTTAVSSKDTSNKIYLIGATAQLDIVNETYSHNTVYVGTDGYVYSGGGKTLIENPQANADGTFYRGNTAPSGAMRMNYSGDFYATRVFNAVFNDYAELFLKYDPDEELNPGDVVVKVRGKNAYTKSNSYEDELVVGVVSDQYGHLLGGTGDPEYDKKHYIPVGLAGKVNVNIRTFSEIEEGDLLVSYINGLAIVSTNNKPGTIIGKVLNILESNNGITKAEMLIMNK